MNLYIPQLQFILQLRCNPSKRENRQMATKKAAKKAPAKKGAKKAAKKKQRVNQQKANSEGDAKSVPPRVFACIRKRAWIKAMTRRRWIAERWDETSASVLGANAEHLIRVLRVQPG